MVTLDGWSGNCTNVCNTPFDSITCSSFIHNGTCTVGEGLPLDHPPTFNEDTCNISLTSQDG